MSLYLVELSARNISTDAVTTLRYGTSGFVTGPNETPANTYYEGRISQPVTITRDLFEHGATMGRGRVVYGDLILENGDGELDFLLDRALGGREITIRRSDVANPSYPSDFDTVLVGTMDQPQFRGDTVTIRIRDKQLGTDIPFQATKYDGDNVLPNGLEGTANDLKGKPKPIVLGKVTNVPAVCVNTTKLIYQVHDGALDSIDAVYDRGVALIVDPDSGTSVREVENPPSLFAGLAYGNGIFLAVGNKNGTALSAISADGESWSTHGLDTSVSVTGGFGGNCAEFFDGRFVVVADDGDVLTSVDGIVWTLNSAAFGASDLKAIAYSASLGRYVAVGQSTDAVKYSSDLVNWTDATPSSFCLPYDVTYSDDLELFVLVGQKTGSGGGTVNQAIWTSEDGATWTEVTGLGTDNEYLGIVEWIDALSLFVAATIDDFANGVKILTSADGSTWTLRHTFSGSAFAQVAGGIAYGDGLVVVGTGDGQVLATSPDGVTWTDQTDLGFDSGKVAFGNHRFSLWTKGIRLPVPLEPYASETDLLDDTKAPGPGAVGTYLAGGMFRLGSSPDGLITADVTEGDDATDRTAGQIFTRALQQGGYTSSDWSASDITALDTADDSVCGIFVGEETTLAEVLDKISDTVGAWWGVDRDGTFRIKQLTAPDMADSVLTITANDLLRPLERLAPGGLGGGLPVWRQVVRWGRIYAVQTSDIAGSVTDARRGVIGKEWRDAASEDTAVKDDYLLSQQVIRESLYTAAADAAAEALRRLTLYKTRRDVFELWLPMNADTVALELGDTIILEHPRYGLEYGAPFVILGIDTDAKNEQRTLTVWGNPLHPVRDVYIVPDGAGDYLFSTTSTGSLTLIADGTDIMLGDSGVAVASLRIEEDISFFGP